MGHAPRRVVVNVMSRCRRAPRYAGTEKLRVELFGRGFTVIGFPRNQAGGVPTGRGCGSVRYAGLRR
ncbi:hypothetical protein [Frankia sp. CiP3]|uniref:hypothetical protein n=1 Tax=Frankia sp. CiP3 TaxID=2880971 RepID=UPI002103A3D2|nr:hypothetical protein [Frankia sp. CiP3]